MGQRKDDIEHFYNDIDSINQITIILFWITALFSIVVLFLDVELLQNYKPFILKIYLILICAHFILSQYVYFYLYPRAENKRRKGVISDSLNVKLVTEKTEKYYNNNFPPSMKKLAVNLFENVFFSKSISEEMLSKERCKIFFYFLFLLLAYIAINFDFNIPIVLTQFFLSGEIFIKYLNLEIYFRKNRDMFEIIKNFFIDKVDFESDIGKAYVIEYLCIYESIKAHTKVKLSSKLFYEMNDDLSSKWESIKTDYSLNF